MLTPIHMFLACMIRTRAEEKLARKAGRMNKTWALNEDVQQVQPCLMDEIERRTSRITNHGFLQDTRHETRFFPVPPATPRRATPRPANGFFTRHETRNTNHGLYRRPDRRARRPLTTSLRISTRPFLDILGLLPPDNVFLPPDYVFLPPDYDFFRIITILLPTIPQNSSEFLGILRITPQAAVHAPSVAAPAASGLLPLRRTQNELMLRKEDVLYCIDQSEYGGDARPVIIVPSRQSVRDS